MVEECVVCEEKNRQVWWKISLSEKVETERGGEWGRGRSGWGRRGWRNFVLKFHVWQVPLPPYPWLMRSLLGSTQDQMTDGY